MLTLIKALNMKNFQKDLKFIFSQFTQSLNLFVQNKDAFS